MDAQHAVIRHLATAIIFPVIALIACTPSEYRSMPALTASDIEKFEPLADQPRVITLRSSIPDYTIGIGDEIKVMIYDHPKDSTRATELGEVLGHEVDESGMINIPLVKRVPIEGMTRHETSQKLEKLYATYIQNPHVMFDIVKYNSKFYYVTGAVADPGKYPIKVKTNLLEAVTRMVPYVNDAFIQTIYMKRDGTIYPVNLAELGRSQKDFSNIFLRDGDTFYIPPPAANRAYILGEVIRPGAYPLSGDAYTLIDLISEAGGIDPVSGKKEKIHLIRRLGGEFKVAVIPFDRLYSGRMPPLKLIAGDRVLVTPTPMTSYNRVIQKLLPTFQLINAGTGTYNNVK